MLATLAAAAFALVAAEAGARVLGDETAPGDRAAATPVPFPRTARIREADLLSVRLDISVDFERRRIEGSATHAFAGISEAAGRLTFDHGPMEIRSARDASGRKLAFDSYADRTVVHLLAPLKAPAKATVVLDYSVSPREGAFFCAPHAGDRRAAQLWTHGETEDNRNWFPVWDSPNDKALFEVLVTCPRGTRAIANGRLVSKHPLSQGRNRFHYQLGSQHSTYLPFLAVGDYAVVIETWRGKPVEYWVPAGREAEAKTTFGRTPAMLEFFSKRFGVPYPYEKYAQVICYDFVAGAMENTTVTSVADTLLHDTAHHPDSNADATIAHEIVHQWFGDLVTCNDWGEIWLNEGFATYGERLWREHAESKDDMMYSQMNAMGWAFGMDRFRPRPVVSKNYADSGDMFDGHSYAKGGWVLHMLRHEIGDDAFFRALTNYLERHRGKNVVTADFQAACEESAGRSLEEFFHQWLFRPGHPVVEVSYSFEPTAGSPAGRARLTVKQVHETKAGAPEAFRFRTVVDFEGGGGRHSFPIRVEKREQSFEFPLPSRPSMVRLDPQLSVFAEWRSELPDELWLRRLATDDVATGRIQAVRALELRPLPLIAEAIARSVASDRFWGVRLEAARALGRIGGDSALVALRSGLADANARVRAASAEALGSLGPTALSAAPDLERFLAREKGYAGRAAAVRSLAAIRAPGTEAAARSLLVRESHVDSLRSAGLEALAELRPPGIEDLLRAWTLPTRSLHARSTAAWELVRIALERGDPSIARATLEAMLLDPGRRVQGNAIRHLRALGDERAGDALREHAARSAYAGVRKSANETAAALRDKKAEWPDGVEKQVRTVIDALGAAAAREAGRPKENGR